jgi:hypothetical protein
MKTTHRANYTFYGFRVSTSRTDGGGTETTVSHGVDVLFRYHTKRSRVHVQHRRAVEWTESWETRLPGSDSDDSESFAGFLENPKCPTRARKP